MVLIGLCSMAFGSYLTLQRNDTEELRKAVQNQTRQIAVLEYQMNRLEQDRERERDRRAD